MTALGELVNLAAEKGYSYWDTTDGTGLSKRRSYTFGQEEVFCLHVRFDSSWRVVNAIYIKWEGGGGRERYVYNRERNKRDKLYWVLNFLPDTFEYWDGLFGKTVGATPAGEAQ